MNRPRQLESRKVLIFVGDDYEDLELWYPRLRLAEAGAEVVVAGERAPHTYRGKHGYPCEAQATIAELRADDFDAVVIPGGWMPDKLRRNPKVLDLVRGFHDAGRPVAAICHGPWINASAGICRGVRMTGSAGLRDDIIHAGARWADEPVVVDGHVITSRKPDDLPDFCRELINALAQR